MEPFCSLYVGDLDPSVTEGQLIENFSVIEGFVSAVICKDRITEQSLCYGYVNFFGFQQATRAIEIMNHRLMNGKAIRVMWSQRNSEARRSGIGNVFVKNLDGSIDNVKLQGIFSKYGHILSCKVEVSQEGKSKGYGFVQFESAESASSAIEKVNGSIIEENEIYVGHFIKKSDRVQADLEAKYTNLYVKNLDEEVTEDILREKFLPFGKITSLVISRDSNCISKGFGFVNFEDSDDAKRAKESMNGTQLGSKVLYVARAQKKSERQKFLRHQFEERRKQQLQKYKGLNVYVKNISDDVDDAQLKDYFSQCGSITSAKIMRDNKGMSRGFGFVCFSNSEEANKAIITLNGVMFHQKPLYVAVAQSKEERRAILQTLFARRNAELLRPLNTSVIPGFPSCYPPNCFPPYQKFMYQPFYGNSTLGGPSFQSPLLPMIPSSPKQHRGRMNRQISPHLTFWQEHNQFVDKSSGYHQRTGNTRYMANGQPQPVSDRHIVSSADPSNSCSVEAKKESVDLSSMLAAASPEERKTLLGERLYPLVEKLKCDLATKITGMLLEMDNSELLLLLESPESLAAKVEQAVQVLELHKNKACNGEAGQPDAESPEVTSD